MQKNLKAPELEEEEKEEEDRYEVENKLTVYELRWWHTSGMGSYNENEETFRYYGARARQDGGWQKQHERDKIQRLGWSISIFSPRFLSNL